METCQLCERSFQSGALGEEGICEECRERHALAGSSPPMRPLVPCTRCQGRVFVRCFSIRERAASGGDYASEYVAPLAATFAHTVYETFFAGRKEASPDLTKPRGIFEAYICRSCGFVELYVRDAARIPIGPEYNTQLIELPETGPYR